MIPASSLLPRDGASRFALATLVGGFAIGTFTHSATLIDAGWLPYRSAPLWMNVYWTALTFLDPLAAALLVVRRRVGLILAIAIMVSDVAINSYAAYGMRLKFIAGPLQLQTLFGGFLLGAAGFLWRRSPDHQGCDDAA